MADDTLDPRRHQVLAGASRAAVLELLRSSDHALGVAEVADAVGLHANTVRSHLDLLVDTGYASRSTEAPRGPGRPRLVYRATAATDDGRNYRLLAELLARYLVATNDRPGAAAVAAGRDWAEHAPLAAAGAVDPAEAVDRVVRMLADAGFAPELSGDGTSIRLHHCPFRELAETQRDVVCGAHLGIIQGALAELDAPVEATRLLPLVEPDLCIASLARRGESPAAGAAAS